MEPSYGDKSEQLVFLVLMSDRARGVAAKQWASVQWQSGGELIVFIRTGQCPKSG
jgi:hypothetical protein